MRRVLDEEGVERIFEELKKTTGPATSWATSSSGTSSWSNQRDGLTRSTSIAHACIRGGAGSRSERCGTAITRSSMRISGPRSSLTRGSDG